MTTNELRTKRRARNNLVLASTSMIACLAAASAAQAQTAKPDFAIDIAQSARPDFAINAPQTSRPDFAVDVPQAAAPHFAEDMPQVAVEGPGEGYDVNPGQPGSIFQEGINGVGQFYRADGFVCTGSLINPRTVLFAAHCVNDIGTDAFGSDTGGVPAAFSFQGDAVDGLRSWIRAGYSTVTEDAVYNVNQILFNPQSIARPESQGFIEGDVAIASLDTPAVGIPTWAILFSPLSAPDSIDSADGTGYHVISTGYGITGYGNGPTAEDVDFRRRAAENMIGILGSLNDRNDWLFGPDDYGLPQNLYQLDFDDPNRENPYDFNVFKDEAQNPEGITGGGDSGGPLILDQEFAEQVVIGVLSGGSRFFGAQPYTTYGTTSFYQPLYLFWDWIAENSPYRYVSAKEGDGMWSDPDHWVTTLDPAFRVIDADGKLVNGIPTAPGAGAYGEDPNQFGQVCDGEACVDLATGDIVDYDGNVLVPAGTQTTETAGLGDKSNIGKVAALISENLAQAGSAGANAAAVGTAALPAATIENGLPGASGFVPMNSDPYWVADPQSGELSLSKARYYDVDLSAAGTTTMDMQAVIDHLVISGDDAGLDVTADGLLLSLTEINQKRGKVNVDGLLATYGDYSLTKGLISGTGSIVANVVDNVSGVIAPATIGTTGTLTINGSVMMASASGLAIDLGENGVSDVLDVRGFATDSPFGTIVTSGIANLGGAVMFTATDGTIIRPGYSYTFLTADGGITSQFNATNPISAVLFPELTYGADSVSVRIVAGSYAQAVDRASGIQTAYAGLLDRNRAQYDKYSNLYGAMDMLQTAPLRATLESLAPRAQTAAIGSGTAMVEANARFFANRIDRVRDGNAGGTLALYGQPMQIASAASLNPAMAVNVANEASAQPMVEEGVLPDDMSAFIAGGYINGNSRGMPTASPYVRNEFDGFFVAGGVEKAVDTNGMFGIAFSYTDINGDPGVPGQKADSKLYQLTFYSATTFANGISLDSQISGGAYSVNTERNVTIGADSYDLTARDTAFALTGEVGLSKDLTPASALSITPRIAGRFTRIGFTPTAEQGGGPALQYDLGNYDSLQGRAGVKVATKGRFQPYATATFVHDFKDKPAAFGANFVGGVGPNALFAMPGSDKNWGELGAGISTGGRVSVSAEAFTTVARSDVEYQTYRASLRIAF
ncbi:MAG: autotransporter domain-containing protein [Sphingomonas sp.]|nr:autotransporter domain-containing protein [Sphingomonas sp.]